MLFCSNPTNSLKIYCSFNGSFIHLYCMYFKEILIALCLVLCVSCRPAKEEDDVPPAYVLEEPVFIKVLTDCYLGEGAAGINVKNVTGEKFDSAYIFNPFKDNNISKQQFDTTIAWYSSHPKRLKEVYNKLLENLSRILAIGTFGKVEVYDKYKGKDMKFFFADSKMDSIINSTKRAGYDTKTPYRIRY
jgi:hypothetical protein